MKRSLRGENEIGTLRQTFSNSGKLRELMTHRSALNVESKDARRKDGPPRVRVEQQEM